MSKVYEHIFFDLDHTLWDFDTNSKQTLFELLVKYRILDKMEFNFEGFHAKFIEVNFNYWELYRIGQISKETLRAKRFQVVFNFFNIFDEELIQLIAKDYVNYGPQKTGLIFFTTELLNYLNPKYSLHIITNGFTEVQYTKLHSSGIYSFFKEVITSEKSGFKKPDNAIFDYALNSVKSSPEKCLMIGDELQIDIIGARNSGIDQIYFNPEGKIHKEKVTYEVKNLNQILTIL